MRLRNGIISIVLSLMVVTTFMPMTGQAAFAVESEPTETTEPETTEPETTKPETIFNYATAVTGVKRIGYTYKSVTIGWSPVEKAKGYQVYSATKKNGKYSRICTTSGKKYYDNKNKKLGKNRYYKIRAYGVVNGKTVYGRFSNIFAAKPNLPAPVARTSGGSNKITVSWNKVSGATRYKVYRATSRNGKYKRLTTTKKRSYTGNSVTKNKKYYYKVRAFRGSRSGYYCGPIEGITILPAPSVTKVSNNPDGGINVSWSGVSNAVGYQIYRATNYKSGFKYVGTTKARNFYDADDSLKSGTTYYYKVRAYARINRKSQVGYFSIGGYREAAVAQAKAWVGAKEGSRTQRKIISIYNSKTKVGRISYKTPWCVAFVSAVGINTGNSVAIPIDNYCPRMLKKFPSRARKSNSYVPASGDLTFFDWNKNKVPDHVGMVSNVKGQTVSTIEGNTNIEKKYSTDGVYVRTYNTNWAKKKVLSYCIPAYNERGKITYNYSEPVEISAACIVENPVAEAVVEEAVEVVENGETLQPPIDEQNLQTPSEEQTIQSLGEEQSPQSPGEEQNIQSSGEEQNPQSPGEKQNSQPPESDCEAVQLLLNYIDEENPADESQAEESTFNAFLVFKACEDMGIEACVVTEIGTNGEEKSYNEIIMEGETYLVDATNEGITPVDYIPEEIN